MKKQNRSADKMFADYKRRQAAGDIPEHKPLTLEQKKVLREHSRKRQESWEVIEAKAFSGRLSYPKP